MFLEIREVAKYSSEELRLASSPPSPGLRFVPTRSALVRAVRLSYQPMKRRVSMEGFPHAVVPSPERAGLSRHRRGIISTSEVRLSTRAPRKAPAHGYSIRRTSTLRTARRMHQLRA